jgi:hypothetical protein
MENNLQTRVTHLHAAYMFGNNKRGLNLTAEFDLMGRTPTEQND